MSFSRLAVTQKSAVVVGVLAVTLVTSGCAAHSAPSTTSTHNAVTTTQVSQGTVVSSNLVQGTLGYGTPVALNALTMGTLTAIAAVGAIVTAGQSLYSVDNVPIYLFTGALPAWRTFGAGMTAGPDVLQLMQNLKALGYFAGTPGSTFTASGASAISKWQKATGQTVTGMIPFGNLVFQPGALRVDSSTLPLGASVSSGAAVLTTTSPTRVVSVPLPLTSQGRVKIGDKVSVQLPDGTAAAGTVVAVGAPVKSDASASATTSIPVTVTFDDQTKAGTYSQGGVTVTFASASHPGVLSVPIEAILAIGSDSFAVKAVDSAGKAKTIPVTLGLFGGGRVEISGPGVVAGLRVQVAN